MNDNKMHDRVHCIHELFIDTSQEKITMQAEHNQDRQGVTVINMIVFAIVSLVKDGYMVTLHRIQSRVYADFNVYVSVDDIQKTIAGISGYQFKD